MNKSADAHLGGEEKHLPIWRGSSCSLTAVAASRVKKVKELLSKIHVTEYGRLDTSNAPLPSVLMKNQSALHCFLPTFICSLSPLSSFPPLSFSPLYLPPPSFPPFLYLFIFPSLLKTFYERKDFSEIKQKMKIRILGEM